jgi:hypothetical protein
MIYFIFYLAAKKRNPLTALQEDEPIPSPAPSSVLQMPFTPGRTPNKNRGMILRNYLFHFQRSSPMHLTSEPIQLINRFRVRIPDIR